MILNPFLQLTHDANLSLQTHSFACRLTPICGPVTGQTSHNDILNKLALCLHHRLMLVRPQAAGNVMTSAVLGANAAWNSSCQATQLLSQLIPGLVICEAFSVARLSLHGLCLCRPMTCSQPTASGCLHSSASMFQMPAWLHGWASSPSFPPCWLGPVQARLGAAARWLQQKLWWAACRGCRSRSRYGLLHLCPGFRILVVEGCILWGCLEGTCYFRAQKLSWCHGL